MLVPTVYFLFQPFGDVIATCRKDSLFRPFECKYVIQNQHNSNVNDSSKAQTSCAVALHHICRIFFSAGFESVPVLYICMQWPCLYISRGTRAYTDIFNSFQWYARPGGANHWWEKSPTCPSTHLTGTSLSINLILMTWLYYTILYTPTIWWSECDIWRSVVIRRLSSSFHLKRWCERNFGSLQYQQCQLRFQTQYYGA